MRRSVDLYIYVADVDAYHAEVVQRGVHVHEPLTTQWWGDRNFQVKDPAGYLLIWHQPDGRRIYPAGRCHRRLTIRQRSEAAYCGGRETSKLSEPG